MHNQCKLQILTRCLKTHKREALTFSACYSSSCAYCFSDFSGNTALVKLCIIQIIEKLWDRRILAFSWLLWGAIFILHAISHFSKS